MQHAVKCAFPVQLGGLQGQARGWGQCLAVRGDDIAHLRSQLGNELAIKSNEQGMEPMGLVAYIEVRQAKIIT